MAAPSSSLEAEGLRGIPDEASRATRNDPLRFERLISDISAAFVVVPAEAVDARSPGPNRRRRRRGGPAKRAG